MSRQFRFYFIFIELYQYFIFSFYLQLYEWECFIGLVEEGGKILSLDFRLFKFVYGCKLKMIGS